jgi:hypothetical protein
MKCEDVLSMLQRLGAGAEVARRAADEHLADCEDCRNAAHALAVLRADRDLPIPRSSEGAFGRAMHAATYSRDRRRDVRPRRTSFWLGAATGAAIAAGVAVAFMILQPFVAPSTGGVPAVTLAVNEARDVSVAVRSPEPLADAEIHVFLSGEIALQGFSNQRELRWRTNLDRGVNQLTLPLVALGSSGGQVLVEVQHGDKRRSFVVDVYAVPGDRSGALTPAEASDVQESVTLVVERGSA